MEKKFLILLSIFSLFCCQKRKENNLQVISSFYKNLGDSIIVVEYKNEFGFKIYNSKVLLPPINIFNDIKGKIDTHYKRVDNHLLIYSTTYFGKKNNFIDEKEKLKKEGILKDFNSKTGNNYYKNGIIFIFNNKKSSYIIVKENILNMTHNEIETEFYKNHGIIGKDSFVTLPKKYSDSATFTTYKALWNDNVVYNNSLN